MLFQPQESSRIREFVIADLAFTTPFILKSLKLLLLMAGGPVR
jgi:hypothetical protein